MGYSYSSRLNDGVTVGNFNGTMEDLTGSELSFFYTSYFIMTDLICLYEYKERRGNQNDG